MPKISLSAPPKTCLETMQLAVTDLAQRGLLRTGNYLAFLSWTIGGQPSGSMQVETLITSEGESYLLLAYTTASGRAHEYRVDLVRVASNLPGAGSSRFYFVCPLTGRRASILYLHPGTEHFAHRQAYPTKRLYYDSQLELKRFRGLAAGARVDKEWERQYLTRKYRKPTYAGKETKWLAALQEKSLRARLATAQAILRLGPY